MSTLPEVRANRSLLQPSLAPNRRRLPTGPVGQPMRKRRHVAAGGHGGLLKVQVPSRARGTAAAQLSPAAAGGCLATGVLLETAGGGGRVGQRSRHSCRQRPPIWKLLLEGRSPTSRRSGQRGPICTPKPIMRAVCAGLQETRQGRSTGAQPPLVSEARRSDEGARRIRVRGIQEQRARQRAAVLVSRPPEADRRPLLHCRGRGQFGS